jgi:hypothetical protein
LKYFFIIDDRAIKKRIKFIPFDCLRFSFFDWRKEHFINEVAEGSNKFLLIIHDFINKMIQVSIWKY